MANRLYKAAPEHEVFYQDLVALMRKYEHLSPQVMLAIAANMVGKMLALQDQRTLTPEAALKVVADNIEEGNQQAIAEIHAVRGRA